MSDHKKKVKAQPVIPPTSQGIFPKESLFRESVELSPVGIYLTDADGKCTYANATWLKMAGMRLDEALGEGWKKGLHPDDREAIFRSWEKAAKSGETWDHEYRFINKEKEITWVRGLAVKRLDHKGDPIGYLGVNIDINQRIQSLKAEREAHTRLDLIVNNISQVIYLYDSQADQFQYVSPYYQAVWGEPVQAVMEDPLSFKRKVHPQDMAAFQEAVRKEKEENIFFDLEYRIMPDKDTIRWVHSRNMPILDDKGNHILTVGIAEDITARIEAQQKLTRSEEQFRLIAENSTEIIWQLGLDGNVSFISPSVTTMTGYTLDELMGMKYRNIIHPSAIKQALKLFKSALTGEDFPFVEIDVQDKDGNLIPVETSVTAI